MSNSNLRPSDGSGGRRSPASDAWHLPGSEIPETAGSDPPGCAGWRWELPHPDGFPGAFPTIPEHGCWPPGTALARRSPNRPPLRRCRCSSGTGKYPPEEPGSPRLPGRKAGLPGEIPVSRRCAGAYPQRRFWRSRGSEQFARWCCAKSSVSGGSSCEKVTPGRLRTDPQRR